MKTPTFLILFLASPALLVAQYRGGCSLTVGIAESAPRTFSVSYLHPVFLNQLYIQGGYRYFGTDHSEFYSLDQFPFDPINQVQLGVFLGNYLFANPKVTYNWFGNHRSFGWAIAAGMLLRPISQLGIGISIGYDRMGSDLPLDELRSIKKISFGVIANVHPFK